MNFCGEILWQIEIIMTLFENKLLEVKPLDPPLGLVYFIKFRYPDRMRSMNYCFEHGDVAFDSELITDEYGFTKGYSVCPICKNPTIARTKTIDEMILERKRPMIESQLVQSSSKIDGDAVNVVWYNAKLAMDIGPFKKDDIVDTLAYGYDSGEISVSHQGVNYVFEAIIQAGKQIR